jgi:hypothetical protein
MALSLEEQIKEIENEIFNTQKNKATEHHIGKLKAKLARLKVDLEKRRTSGGKGKGFSIKKSGDATVGIIGFPSVGKSTLLNQLTNASSKIGTYDFTTLETEPGVMKFQGADIQLLDLPGLIVGASKGKGRGREILSAVRTVDLIIILVDTANVSQIDSIEKELYSAGIRLNETLPDVVVSKKGEGGITVNSTVSLTFLDEEIIKAVASQFVINADITIREDITEDQLIDVFSQNRVYVPAFVVINKVDLISNDFIHNLKETTKKKHYQVLSISAKNRIGLDRLRSEIFTQLKLIRVYMKPVGKKTDFNTPLILKQNETIEHVCKRLHRDFKRNFRYAIISGPSAKHPAQRVGLDHVLHDGDIVTIVKYKV